jgi:hypothetical protein
MHYPTNDFVSGSVGPLTKPLKHHTYAKEKRQKGKPEVHNELKGFDIKINEFGEITSNMDVEELNEFLDENVEDKKLQEREDNQADENETNSEKEE